MDIKTWEIERCRAWVAFMVAYNQKERTYALDAKEADRCLEEWLARFPKPEEK